MGTFAQIIPSHHTSLRNFGEGLNYSFWQQGSETMQPIKHKKLSDEVMDRLITAISSQEFPPGSKLPSERELMLRLGVGRPVVREAMQKLEQMGLLRISHGERARVVKPTADDIIAQISSAMVLLLSTSSHGLEDLKQARLMAEVALVRTAVAKASKSDLDQLDKIHERLIAARGNAEKFVEQDMAFHAALASISGNELFAALVRGMLGWMARFKREMVSVKGGEKITIAQAMGEHLQRANHLYKVLLADPA
jgi:GntR family transcriptional regulator, sialic acid-inducible nan operon repressor